MSRGIWVASAVAAALAVGQVAPALEIGDKAPAIEVKEWVSNKPVTLASAKGKVLVVEFWATWCGPCKVTIPHVNKLHARHQDKDVVFVGISNEDVAKVKAFLKTTPMNYHVGVAASREAYKAYMEGVRGIPHAFVVDKQGTVAWAGHPMMGMDAAIKQIASGAFDPAKAKKLAELRKQLQKARSYDQAFAALDAMIAAVPDDPGAYRRKRQLLERQNEHDEAHALLLAMAKACAADADVLAEVAAELATTPDLKRRDLAQALTLADKALEITQAGDADVLAVQARVHYEQGHLAKAIAIAEKASGLASGDDAEEFKAAVAFYRAELARRKADPDAKL